MRAATTTPLRIGLRADASATVGVGHVVRQLALSDEIRARGGQVAIFGRISGVPWLAEAIQVRGLTVLAADPEPERLTRAAVDWDACAFVLDGYGLDRDTGRALRAAGLTVLAVQDGPFGSGQEADLVLDQNAGASGRHVPSGTSALLGLEYALFRDEVLKARNRPRPAHSIPRGLLFSGGTDPGQATPLLTDLVLKTGVPVHLIAVAVDDAARSALAGLALTAGQHLDVIDATPHLMDVAAECDFVVSAAGSSVWEMMCLGVPAAIVAVSANQQPTLDLLAEQPIAYSLGHLDRLRSIPAARREAVAGLRTLVTSASERSRLRSLAQEQVDGRGRERVVDALVALNRSRTSHRSAPTKEVAHE